MTPKALRALGAGAGALHKALARKRSPGLQRSRRRSARCVIGVEDAEVTAARRDVDLSVLTQDSLKVAKRHLEEADPLLAPIIRGAEDPKFLLRKDDGDSCFTSLAKGILYQQISVTAGTAIVGRLQSACGGADMVTPEAVLLLDEETMRAVGVSGRKASYLKALATEFASGTLTDEGLRSMPDEELRKALTRVKGIGPWTVDMFSMFYLGRPDILPVGDLAVRKGLKVLHNLPELPGVPEMESLTKLWRPFRSVGSSYMWKMEDEKVPRSPGKSKGPPRNGKSPAKQKTKVPLLL